MNKKALRSVLGDVSSTYPELLTKAGLKTLEDNMIVTVYKCKNLNGSGLSVPFIPTMTRRGQHKNEGTTCQTTTFGLKSFRYYAATH